MDSFQVFLCLVVWVDFLLLGVKKLIQSYSGGKIKLRYAIVEPVVPVKKSRQIELVVGIFGYSFILGLFTVLLGYESPIAKCFGFIVIISGPFVIARYLKNRLSGVLKKGEVLFEEDVLTVFDEHGVLTATVPYKTIFRMTYKGNVTESFLGRSRNFLSYLVKFRTDENVLFTFELYKYPSLTESEKSIQRTVAPQLPKVLESTRPRYGIVEI